MPTKYELLEVDGREVRVTNPDKIFFPSKGITKLDLVNYYLTVADGVLVACRERPTLLYRWPNGCEGEPFYQKRIPQQRPDWLETVTVHFPSGRSAEMLVITDAASIAWAINLGCIDLNPWPVRRADVDHSDELRVDLDPTPGIPFEHARDVAMVVKDVLEEHRLVGWPKSSGKRGIHIFVRIEPRWQFGQVRRAALALAREVERRSPLATTAWWKEQRHGVFVDYNQNARDRTMASAWSVRPIPDARVSCPVTWAEVSSLQPEARTIETVATRFEEKGDPQAEMDASVGSIEPLLELADRDENEGLSDAPWPPHFPKGRSEPPRVAPSRRRST